MLFYNGSKLESDLDDLKKEIKKTDYEKNNRTISKANR